jgi:hypothetical protein
MSFFGRPPQPSDPSPPRRSLSRCWPALILAAAALAGCSRQPAGPSVTATRQADPTDEMVDAVRETLRKSSDVGACRRLVEQLNVYLGRPNIGRKPEPLSAAERAALEKEFALKPEEVAEVGRPEFTPLDAHYLDQTLLFRDIARALDVAQMPPAERAAAALAWVVRNLHNVPPGGPALPPSYAALRGAGTPLERIYVLLTLLRQLDLDACLIGDASAANTPEGVWAVGVLADGQVSLYDARLGLPLPGPGGKGVLTLAQARSDADAFKLLALDPKLPYDVTPERAKQSQVYVTVAMTGLSPRMRFLQGLIPEGTARVAADPAAVRERFRQALTGPAYAGVEVRFWNPPVEDAYPRVLYWFLPPNEGGGDRSDPSVGRMARYYSGAVPWDRLPPFLLALRGEPGSRIRAAFAERLTMFSQPGRARDLIDRGQFDQATEQLVGLRSHFAKRPFSERELQESSSNWSKEASADYADLLRAERAAEKGDPAGVAAREEARAKIDDLWKRSRWPMLYIEFLAAEPLTAEATYLLALCKHEQAERQRQRPGGSVDRAAWQTARTWWNQFVSAYPNSPVMPAARRNLAFAQEALGQKAEAKALLASLANSDLSPLEKLACRYWESRIK